MLFEVQEVGLLSSVGRIQFFKLDLKFHWGFRRCYRSRFFRIKTFALPRWILMPIRVRLGVLTRLPVHEFEVTMRFSLAAMWRTGLNRVLGRSLLKFIMMMGLGRAMSSAASHHRWIIGRSMVEGRIKISGLPFAISLRKRPDWAPRWRRTRRRTWRVVYNIMQWIIVRFVDDVAHGGNRRGRSNHGCDSRSYENEYNREFQVVLNHVEFWIWRICLLVWRPAQK